MDCANGATAHHIAPKVFHELGADVIEIATQPNGFNINDHWRHPHQAPTGSAGTMPTMVSFPGRRWRPLMMVDRAGRLYDGDQLLYVMAKSKARRPAGRRRGWHGDDQSGYGTRAGAPGHRICPRAGRRPLYAGAIAGARRRRAAGHLCAWTATPLATALFPACKCSPRCRC